MFLEADELPNSFVLTSEDKVGGSEGNAWLGLELWDWIM